MPAASSIYWNSEDSQRSSRHGSEPTSSSSSSGGVEGRRYIDPWDLENYAYLRRRQQLIAAKSRNEDPGIQPQNLSPQSSESSNSDSQYWYPTTAVMREPGYDPITSIEELYLGPPRHNNMDQANQYPANMKDSTYEDDTRYVTPNPVYAPLSDLEYAEEADEHPGPLMIRPRRHKSIKNRVYHEDESPCPYHGPLQENALSKESGSKTSKPLGLNTYGHLRIDYGKSWNSLNRKMKK